MTYKFDGEKDIKEIEIPNGYEIIDNDAFKYCKSLKSVTIPNSVT